MLVSALALALLAAPDPGAATAVRFPAPDDLNEKLTAWFRTASKAAPGEWGIAVADQSGQLLWAINPTKSLIPASTVKVFTTGYARSVVGGEARQRTRVIGTGEVGPDGTWLGTWALELNGDMTLERPARGGPSLGELAHQLASLGIRQLTGPMAVQSAEGAAGADWPKVWAQRHRGRSFAPLVGALTVNENSVAFAVSPGGKAGAPARVTSSAPSGLGALVTVNARTVDGRANQLSIRAQPGGRYLVTGTIGVRAQPRYYAGVSNDPRAVLEAAWNAALQDAGIRWTRTPGASSATGATGATDRQILAEVASAPFDSVASEVNRRSHNLGAELLLRWATGGDHAGELLTAHVRQVTGEHTGVHLVDGSGLSSDDRATAWSFVAYLANFPSSLAGRNFPLLLPANGQGTLRKLASGLPGQGVVRAKTGTLANVSSLVGYLGRADGVLVISMLYNGPQVYAARQHQWKLFRLLGADGIIIESDTLTTPGALGL